MAQQLILTNLSNIWRASDSSIWVDNSGRHLIGRADGRYRMARYTFEATNPLTSIFLKFTDDPNGAIFSQYGGVDKRASGFGFYITKDSLMKDWKGFNPANPIEGSGELKFSDNTYSVLTGEMNFSKNPLEAGTYYLFIYGYQTPSTGWGCTIWAPEINDVIYYPNTNDCTYESYTAPTAPVNFAFTYPVEGKQLLLSTGFTVTWDEEETVGINNPTKGYELFLNESKIAMIKKAEDSTLDETERLHYSYTYEFEEDYQGKEISVSIRTIATVKIAEYSELESITGSVNTRPSMPNISKKNYSGNGVYISGNIELTLEGQDSEDSGDSAEKLIYWREYSENGEVKQEKVIGGTFKSSIDQTVTYYFKTEDSLGEYSEVREFIVNCYPKLTADEVNSTRYNGKTERLNLEVNGKCRAKTTVGKDLILSKGISSINCVDTFGLGKNVTMTFYPLDSDGIDLGMGTNAPESLTIDTPELPSLKNVEVYDSWEGENIINSSDYPCFFKRIRLKIPRFDSRVEDKPIQIIFNEKPVSASRIIVGDYFYLNGEFDIAANTTKKPLSIKLSEYDEISLGDYNRIVEFPFTNLKTGYGGMPIIYDNGAQVKFARNTQVELEQWYGIKLPEEKTIPEFAMSVSYALTNADKTTETNIVSLDMNWSDSTIDTYAGTKDFSGDILKDLGISNTAYFGQKNLTFNLSITNAYGHTKTASLIQTYDFEKSAEISVISLEYQKNSNNDKSWASPSSADSFKYIEGMPIKISYTIKRWSATPTNIEVRTKLDGELLKSFEDNSGNSFKGTTTTKAYEFNLSKITNSPSLWQLYLNEHKCIDESFYTLPINDKIVTLGGFQYNDGLYTLQSDYSISSNDNDTTLAHYLFIDGKEYELSKDDESGLLKFSFKTDQESRPDPMSNQDSLIGQLRIKETASAADYSITKTWDSNTVVIYNIVPTVSYRKNHLGINTLSPSAHNDSIVYIGSYEKRNKIYFVSSENQSRIIDIESGGINGFVVDCGSWTGIPGGLVPTNPDLPVGLATIAYTGDIKDLEQKTETVIILSGGSSKI